MIIEPPRIKKVYLETSIEISIGVFVARKRNQATAKQAFGFTRAETNKNISHVVTSTAKQTIFVSCKRVPGRKKI